MEIAENRLESQEQEGGEVRVKPRRKKIADFRVRKGIFGYEVVPTADELWFDDAESAPMIEVHNLTGDRILAEVVDRRVQEKMEKSAQQSDSENEVVSLKFRPNAKPEVAEFEVLIWCMPCSGVVFRARANSDPRIRVLPSPL